MRIKRLLTLPIAASLYLAAVLVFSSATRVQAHCDTLAGPVVQTAKTALETGNITPVLKWVRAEDEQEIRTAFSRSLSVRGKDAAIRELADIYFYETLVRIHRAGEGAPYKGLQAADTVDPAVVLADQALAEGNVDELTKILTTALTQGLRERFQQTLLSRNHAAESIKEGREFVKDYVLFTHYVEGLHTLIQGIAAPHDGGAAGDGKGHGH